MNTLKARADWKLVREAVCAELKQVNPDLDHHAGKTKFFLGIQIEFYELNDFASGIQIEFHDDGTASLSISGWGDWYTRAPQIRMYLDVFEKHGFSAYDEQCGEKWKHGRSVEDITALLEKFVLPEIDLPEKPLTGGKGCQLTPLTDDEWDQMK
jgi:hypothetical protein